MANYLVTHYKGKYRLKTPYDLQTNQFPREFDDTFADNDVYVDCYNNIQIFSYGHGILETYIPSLGRGRNIIKAIGEEITDKIIFDIVSTDSEVLFKFKAKDMDRLEKYLKPKTSGASISPFSTKNLPKSKYSIPDEDLHTYNKLIENIPQNQRITLAHISKNYLKSLVTKRNTWEQIKADMLLKGLKGKEYIHSTGRWNDYLKYMEKMLCQI